jgi:hypothetical protein
LLDQLGQQLAQEFGRAFESRNLRRMVKFAEAFPDAEIVSTLSTQLSWSHLVTIVALKTPEARAFYAQRAAQDGWSVRELNHQIDRKAFERTEIAAAQSPTLAASPALIFKDPYFLDVLGLHQGQDEADLKAAILRQLEASSWRWRAALRSSNGKNAWSSTGKTFTSTSYSSTAGCGASWPSNSSSAASRPCTRARWSCT